MPWEIDNALLTFTQLKKSFYHISKDANITIESVLNLSSKFIDWSKSQLPKEFFIDKYNDISLLLNDYTHIKRIYDGDEVYGYLNLQRESLSKEIDYYIGVCPDFYFSEHLLALLIESTRVVKNKYFVITPQIYKKWDKTWDEITNPDYLDIPYDKWDEYDVYEIRNQLKVNNRDISLIPTDKSKWAWWFDIYSKEFYENLCPVHDDWNGYGPWDWYSMILSEKAKGLGYDFQQYVINGQTILDMDAGDLKGMSFNSYYKKYLHLLPDYSPTVQREIFEKNMLNYLNKGLINLPKQ